MLKGIKFQIRGMNRDLSISASNEQLSYENMNIRIFPTDDGTLSSIVNEKGNRLTDIFGIGEYLFGTPIGGEVINNQLILFTTNNNPLKVDKIYKIWFDEHNLLRGKTLFTGNLNFNVEHPIEAISVYENEDIQKVYFVDGVNQTRFINIAEKEAKVSKWNNKSFDFLPYMDLSEKITINRNEISTGMFAPGTIQYCFTYFNRYGTESNIFYTSPLYYLSHSSRGAGPEDRVSVSFSIEIDDINNNFEYIRIYSIQRTSQNGTPIVKKVSDVALTLDYSNFLILNTNFKKFSNVHEFDAVLYNYQTSNYEYLSHYTPQSEDADFKLWVLPETYYSYLKIKDQGEINFGNGDFKVIYDKVEGSFLVSYLDEVTDFEYISFPGKKLLFVDNGTQGELVDPTELLYVGGEDVVFSTLSHKDNTMFLGDIKLNRSLISSTVKDHFKQSSEISFKNGASYGKRIYQDDITGYYSYENQLSNNSNIIKYFKYLETYRFGLQFQHVTGKWSEPIWVNDLRNTIKVKSEFKGNGYIEYPVASMNISNYSIINELISQGYIKVRPLVVLPLISEREVLAQGILAPTVYNVEDRHSNSPFAQSSWFFRPNSPYDLQKVDRYIDPDNPHLGYVEDVVNRDTGLFNQGDFLNTRKAIATLGRFQFTINGFTKTADTAKRGAYAEFRHNKPIPDNMSINAEIQCIVNPDDDVHTLTPDLWVEAYLENYYVDQSILTFHSPEIEFDDSIKHMDSKDVKLRIVGITPFTSSYGDVDIQTSTPQNRFQLSGGEKGKLTKGFNKAIFGSQNISRYGWRGLISAPLWVDQYSDLADKSSLNKFYTGFAIYPWHRNGSLNNQSEPTDEGYMSAKLDKKKMSNIRYSSGNFYFDTNQIWIPLDSQGNQTGISGFSVFNVEDGAMVRIKAPQNSGLGDINYYGTIDKVINVTRRDSRSNGYPIAVANTSWDIEGFEWSLINNNYAMANATTNSKYGIDPVRMKYRSTSHGVIALNYSSSGEQIILPTLMDGDLNSTNTYTKWSVNNMSENLGSNKFFWDKDGIAKKVYQNNLDIDFSQLSATGYGPEYGYLFIGELYNDNVVNRFGGTTEEAFENNSWIPAGEPVNLIGDNGLNKSSLEIVWTEGDTYYQRYDHLKTYPHTMEDQNSIVDIASFMIETRVNIDGRYDRNRGQTNNLTMNPSIFNLMNSGYTQDNNFYTYRSVNSNNYNLDVFRNSITWTKSKNAGELIDAWTNITMAGTMDFDGDKGSVRALRRFNNEIFCFQDSGISQILFNSVTQIASNEGVPIEIASSGKVEGKRYISDNIGCVNKWTIASSPIGLYFIDNITKSIYLFNGSFESVNSSLSDKGGFHSWINTKIKDTNPWTPNRPSSFKVFYDKINRDAYFINNETALAFSELTNSFSSFYSYEDVPYMFNLKNRTIQLKKHDSTQYSVWLLNEGDYNHYFGEFKPFYITYGVSPEPDVDKIFSNIEFKLDSYLDGEIQHFDTFDNLYAWNEYQNGHQELIDTRGKPSSLKKKFRVWRADIPRDSVNKRDRIRNTWTYLKLSKEQINKNKVVLHDLIVKYLSL